MLPAIDASSGSRARISRQVGGQVDGDDLVEVLGLLMGDRHQCAEQTRGMHQGIDATETFEQRRRQTIEGITVGDVERDQGGVVTGRGKHLVVELFQAGLGAATGDDLGTGLGQSPGRTNGLCRVTRR